MNLNLIQLVPLVCKQCTTGVQIRRHLIASVKRERMANLFQVALLESTERQASWWHGEGKRCFYHVIDRSHSRKRQPKCYYGVLSASGGISHIRCASTPMQQLLSFRPSDIQAYAGICLPMLALHVLGHSRVYAGHLLSSMRALWLCHHNIPAAIFL